VPELETTEGDQEEFGWEDVTPHDDGQRDMGEPRSEPESGAVTAPAETAPVTTEPEPTQPAVAADGQTAEGAAVEGGLPGTLEEVMFTLPGGKKITKADLIADDKLLSNLVTHSNQVSHFQKLAEERKAQAEAAMAEQRRVLDEFTQMQMRQNALQQHSQQQSQPPPERPSAQVLESAFAPHLDKLVNDGRLTQEHRTEFGSLISEYLFDQRNVLQTMNILAQQAEQKFAAVDQQLIGSVQPTVDLFVQDRANQFVHAVQQEAASIPGYEVLADQNEWNRLQTFISEKVQSGGFGPDGRPKFDPNFDPITMAQMYDAMTGAALRQQMLLEAAQKDQQQKQTQQAAMVGGETTARAGGPPKPKQPAKVTPEEEAMDFTDPAMARA